VDAPAPRTMTRRKKLFHSALDTAELAHLVLGSFVPNPTGDAGLFTFTGVSVSHSRATHTSLNYGILEFR
jgi:hypothetical protein